MGISGLSQLIKLVFSVITSQLITHSILPNICGAPVAQWVKLWPADLTVLCSNPAIFVRLKML